MSIIQTSLIERLGCTNKEEEYVINRDGTEVGTVIGCSEGGCEVESCRGTVLYVEWKNTEVTECCTHGMNAIEENVWRIQ